MIRNTIEAIIIALLFIALLQLPAIGGELEDEHISDVAGRALERMEAGEIDEMVDLQYELYEISQDPDVSPSCQLFADVALSSAILVEEWGYYPDSQSMAYLNSMILEVLPLAKNDCNLAI